MAGRAAFCGLLIAILVLSLLAPMLHYVCKGWSAKRSDIMDGLSARARLQYFRMFRRDGTVLSEQEAYLQFETFYKEWYGRRFFLTPGILLLLSGLASAALVVFTALHGRGFMENPLFDLPGPAIAALAGAYMWCVNDLTSRARRLDFSPSDVHWSVLRIIVAVPMGYAFAALAADSLAPFIAFALGAFPLTVLNSMLRRLANKKLGIDTASEDSADSILKLQGINKTIVERLYNEDILTVSQLAYCDPVRLVMRSNLTFNFVTDCMNQALAWMYFDDTLNKIRPLGMRGAVEIKHLIDDLESTGKRAEADRKRTAEVVASRIAAVVQQDVETLKVALHEIARDPYTEFLAAVWEDVTPPAREPLTETLIVEIEPAY